jgi:2-methylisocitrate lyase-like PEP mutase family enzyme
MTASADTAAPFRRLHSTPDLLILANAWDAGSARLIESLGAKAIATTSGAVAWSLGYPDGEAVPVPVLVATVAAIARVIRLPLTVDAEAGYGRDPASVGETIAALVGAGAVGVNLEDGAEPPDRLAARIAAAREAAARRGVALFVNARTDVYLRGLAPPEGRVGETLSRARRYRAAGADGIFVPGLRDPGEMRRIAAEAEMPLNVMAWPGLPGAAELARLGVRRLSAGTAIAQAAWGRAAAVAKDLLRDGWSDGLGEGAMTYAAMNALFAERPSA